MGNHTRKQSPVRYSSVALVVLALLAMIVTNVLASAPSARGDSGGGSWGVGGGDLPGATGLGVQQRWYDNPGKDGQATYPQGTGGGSADWLMDQSPRVGDGTMRAKIYNACLQALSIAESRGGSPARVVGIMWAYSGDQPYNGNDAARSGIYFQDALNAWANAGYPGFQGNAATSTVRNLARNLTQGAIVQTANGNMNSGANVSAICTALGESEPPLSYSMNVATVAQNTFSKVGSTNEVWDHLGTYAVDSSISETLSGKITLNYGGFPDTDEVVKSKTKEFSGLSNSESNQRLPSFYPSDFGWTYWPAGKYWYTASIPQQGGLKAAISHGGPTTTDEYWSASGYDLKITTQQKNGFSVSGGKEAVYDEVKTSTSGFSQVETVTANAVLNWDGYNSANTVSASRNKEFDLKTTGTTETPKFTPSDFGWTQWPSGRYWWDITVSRQKNMAAAVDTDDRVASETWSAKYPLSVTTAQKGGFSVAQGTQEVRDLITATAPGGPPETKVDAKVILNWDGYPSKDQAANFATKTVSININGDTYTPYFKPSDFGFSVWPAGRFWFDVQVSKQGMMSEAVDTDDRVPAETWEAQPPPPQKYLTLPGKTEKLKTNPSFASGETLDAHVKAFSSGAKEFWIKDILFDGRVHLGGTSSDDMSKIYVLDPSGNKLPSAKVSAKVVNSLPSGVSAPAGVTVKNPKTLIVKVSSGSGAILPLGDYTLVVPTTTQPTGEDYTFADRGQACWSGENSVCKLAEVYQPGKVTPDPNKVWTLTPGGALTANDPNQTNNQGADQKTFVPGDSVSAVVNGSIRKGLEVPLYAHSITDDWTKASKFVDFGFYNESTDPYLKPHVMVKMPGEAEFRDRTGEFNLSFGKTTTTATAKTGSKFLIMYRKFTHGAC